MSILDPAIRLVGRLSFRNKMHVTAIAFGVPLIVALGVILSGLNARVSAVGAERDALAVQLPALTLLVDTHQYLAASQAQREGAQQLDNVVQARRKKAAADWRELESALAEHGGRTAADSAWQTAWKKDFDQVEKADGDTLAELHSQLRSTLRGELDKRNESAGLLVDGEMSSSRLLDILTAQLPQLIDNAGQAARLGAVVLVNQRVKSSRRTELTLLRGNFNALVQWSMDGLQKVAREHPELAADLDDASSRLNTAYLPIQEAMTTKILDTADFDMTPEAYLELTATALNESLTVARTLAQDTDHLLAARESLLQAQRNGVLLAMLAMLALVIGGFVAAYISIMRGLNGLSAAVNTMAEGDLSARVEITTNDEIGAVGTQFNLMVESLAQRTALLREKTSDIQTMLRHLPQGILTIVAGGAIHSEYSDYLETIFETKHVGERPAIDFIFGDGSLGADGLAQVEATLFACLGEDRINFDFNSHLLAGEFSKTMADGRVKYLELSWSPICDDNDTVEKIMVCVRDVSQLRQLEAEAEQQKRELQMIGQILAVSQEKFDEFASSARRFIAHNESLLQAADGTSAATADFAAQLFRNMHTIKGNARTYGLLQLTHVVHLAEQAYDDLRQGGAFDRDQLLEQLQEVTRSVDEYTVLNTDKLGRKGPGRRGSAEKYVMVERAQVDKLVADVRQIASQQASRPERLVPALQQLRLDLQKLGCETIETILEGVFASLPSLAKELAKEPPRIKVSDHGIVLRNQIADLLRNVFMHLYRNSLDHGIEAVAERFLTGKHPSGTIALDLTLTGEQLVMRLGDDGRGLALSRIRQRAIERGLLAESDKANDAAVAQLIFAAGFSTASVVSEVSGRGVGMDAVQSFVKREGGQISIAFCDDHVGADFRAFETVVVLPAKFAVATAAIAAPAVTPPAAAAAHEKHEQHELADELRAIVGGLAGPGQLAAI